MISHPAEDEFDQTRISPLPARRPRLRAQLLILVVACVLPLFAFGFGNAYFDYRADRTEVGRRALNMARTLSLLVQRDLEARLAALQVLAISPDLQGGDIAAFRARAEAMLAQQLPGSNILLLREDGQQVMNTALPPDLPLPSRRDTTSLRQIFATAQPSVSDVFFGVVVRRPVIALEVPVFGPNGAVIYGLTLNPTVDVFADIVARQQLETGSIVSIFDRKGVFVARTPDGAQFIGQTAGPVLLPRLLAQSEDVMETTSRDGVPVVAAFSHVPNFGWSVAIGLPQAEFIDAAKRAALTTFGIGLVCLALGLTLAFAMARRIARPIAALGDLASALEQDGARLVIATGLAETDDVAQALMAAARRRRDAEVVTRQAVQERERSAALLQTVIEAAPSLIYAKDLMGRMVLANGAFLSAHGKTWADIAGRTDFEFRGHDPAAALPTIDRRVMPPGQAETHEELIDADGHQPRVWLTTKTPLCNADKEVIGLVGVSVDITERKQVEDRLRQMVNELNHRVKNTLATVQAIASYTLRGTDEAIRRTLDARLMALATAHDVLTRERWEGAVLAEVIAGALAPYDGVDDSRFQVLGPSLRLLPRVAVALAMGLHELATNAVKYGALSVADGQVTIRWVVVQGTASRLRITWSERGGPVVTLPTQRGFGTRLIERSLAQDLGGTAHISFAAEGITCVIDAPLIEVLATADMALFPHVGSV